MPPTPVNANPLAALQAAIPHVLGHPAAASGKTYTLLNSSGQPYFVNQAAYDAHQKKAADAATAAAQKRAVIKDLPTNKALVQASVDNASASADRLNQSRQSNAADDAQAAASQKSFAIKSAAGVGATIALLLFLL